MLRGVRAKRPVPRELLSAQMNTGCLGSLSEQILRRELATQAVRFEFK